MTGRELRDETADAIDLLDRGEVPTFLTVAPHSRPTDPTPVFEQARVALMVPRSRP